MSITSFKQALGVATAVAALGFSAQASAAPSFQLDLTTLPLVTTAYTGDGKTGLIDELQFSVPTNSGAVTLTFDGATADFNLGSTFTFTDTGTIVGTAFLPGGFGNDYEGFGNDWLLQGAFNLTGNGSVVGFDAALNPILSFVFTAGSLSLDYVDPNETVQVLTATATGGTGTVVAKPGANVQSASGFEFTADVNTLTPAGFWLDPLGNPFDTSFTLLLTDGNINSTTTTALGGRSYRITSNSDGSASLAVNNVPEPGSLMLVGLGLLGAVAATRRHRKVA